jgi:hypothetical protein
VPKTAALPTKRNAPAYEPSDIVWGAAAIGRVIGKSERAAFHLLESKKLDSAKKVGGRHCASRAKLLAECGA